MLFQMGGQQSDWTGVTFTNSEDITTGFPVDKPLLPISVTNKVYTQGASQITSQSRDNSTFKGFLRFNQVNNID